MSRNLHEERLATTDESGNRIYLYTDKVDGPFKRARTKFYWFLVSIYVFLPWIYINGTQVVLLDIPKREFTFFGTTFLGHDAPLLLFLFIILTLIIAFITAIWGRVWCGWACPQTVFINSIFTKIDEIVEGDARSRRALDRSPLTSSKLLKRISKWTLYSGVSLVISHSFIGYFIGTHNLLSAVTSSPTENMGAFLSMIVITLTILFDFGWFREQFCIIACPYGRLQSVLMDESSLIIAYDKKRGEPRRSLEIKRDDEGDCINCGHCVKVCPTGIDIRRGTQLECIACTMCIDACDEIMLKLDKPKGLIRYDSEANMEGQKNNNRPRIIIYGVICVLALLGLVYALATRPSLSINITRSPSPYHEYKSSGESLTLNQFSISIFSQIKIESSVYITLVKDKSNDSLTLLSPLAPVQIQPNQRINIPLVLKFNKRILTNGKLPIEIEIANQNSTYRKKVNLVGPSN